MDGKNDLKSLYHLLSCEMEFIFIYGFSVMYLLFSAPQ